MFYRLILLIYTFCLLININACSIRTMNTVPEDIKNSVLQGISYIDFSEKKQYSNLHIICFDCSTSGFSSQQCILFCTELYRECMSVCLTTMQEYVIKDYDLFLNHMKYEPKFILPSYIIDYQQYYFYNKIDLNNKSLSYFCKNNCMERQHNCLGLCF